MLVLIKIPASPKFFKFEFSIPHCRDKILVVSIRRYAFCPYGEVWNTFVSLSRYVNVMAKRYVRQFGQFQILALLNFSSLTFTYPIRRTQEFCQPKKVYFLSLQGGILQFCQLCQVWLCLSSEGYKYFVCLMRYVDVQVERYANKTYPTKGTPKQYYNLHTLLP